MTDAEGAQPPRESAASPKDRAARVREASAFGLGALVVLFAALNVDQVKVNWIIGTRQTPLIVVIAVSLLAGAAVGYVVRTRPS
jgi:uncharacterized integral membrane protein